MLRARIRRRNGFTLRELLVVAVVISVLAAIRLPVLTRTRAAAQRAPCVAHLHQIAMAFSGYFQDNDETFPPCGLATIQSLSDLDSFWFRQTSPYLTSPQVLHCPADDVDSAQRTLSAALPDQQNRPELPALSYGANWDLMEAAAWGKPQAKIAAIPFPALTLLVADCTEPWAFGPVYTDAQGVRWSHIAYANGPPVDQAATVFHGGRSGRGHERHGAGSYVAYFDGHVGFMSAARFYREVRSVTDASGKRHPLLVERPLLSPAAVTPEERRAPS